MTQDQLILLKRSLNIYASETEAWAALDNLTHIQGQPVVAFFRRSTTEAPHGDTALGAIFAIGTANGVGKYKACASHDDMMAIAKILNTHITEWATFKALFDKMFTYDSANNAIKANLDFYTDNDKNISAGGLGGSSSSSIGALYQLIDVMLNTTGDGVEGATDGAVLSYDATAGKWKAISQSEIMPDMSDYYTKEETDAAITNAANNYPEYNIVKKTTGLSANVREAYVLQKSGVQVGAQIDIYKDSALQDVKLQDQKLVFTYLKVDGTTATIEVDISKFLTENEFGDGLSVSADGVVSHATKTVTNPTSGEFVHSITNDKFGHLDTITRKKFSSVITSKDVSSASLVNEYSVSVADNTVGGVQLSVVIDTIDGGTF